MGHFTGSGTPPGVGGKGFFGATAPKVVTPPTGTTFMVVGTNTTNPNTANSPKASWRDSTGTWHVIDATALGARGTLGVTHANGVWYMTTNQPGGIGSRIGKTADGSPPAAVSSINTGTNEPLTAIDGALGFKIASLNGNIVTAPSDLSSFTVNPANGPGSYVILGIASDQDPPT